MKSLWLLALLLMLIPGLGAEEISGEEFERRVFAAANAERSSKGLAPLAWDADLAGLARIHSRNMGWEGFFNHLDHEGLQVSQRLQKYYPRLLHAGIGENLYYLERGDRKYDPQQVVAGWMSSADHRANILQPEFTHTGTGIFLIGNKLYVTQVFAIPVLRLLSELPPKFDRDKSYEVEFEYLSPVPGEDLQCLLTTPDPTTRVKINEIIYTEGNIPLKVNWIDASRLRLRLDFGYGKGIYSLQAGWDGYFYPDMLQFRVK